MQNPNQDVSLRSVADQFIALANELAKDGDRGTVGMAIRYAAARYNAFEASMSSYDLIRDKEKILDMFSDDYKKMLLENIDDHINRPAGK
jgi:hypothetical protein